MRAWVSSAILDGGTADGMISRTREGDSNQILPSQDLLFAGEKIAPCYWHVASSYFTAIAGKRDVSGSYLQRVVNIQSASSPGRFIGPVRTNHRQECAAVGLMLGAPRCGRGATADRNSAEIQETLLGAVESEEAGSLPRGM
ncbi:hypothetical protein BV25DRAFT_458451 [Artomyces pyxidatus]|uniref:Uncharacterized protein n=1 Tax=Artomyces pyxidatus TaxID=48021 RepID=A0ACB8T5L0_9AGAM|nr:hypothetical protein BV25DRAFT_458451 [Artomyces pyxidatus]